MATTELACSCMSVTDFYKVQGPDHIRGGLISYSQHVHFHSNRYEDEIVVLGRPKIINCFVVDIKGIQRKYN